MPRGPAVDLRPDTAWGWGSAPRDCPLQTPVSSLGPVGLLTTAVSRGPQDLSSGSRLWTGSQGSGRHCTRVCLAHWEGPPEKRPWPGAQGCGRGLHSLSSGRRPPPPPPVHQPEAVQPWPGGSIIAIGDRQSPAASLHGGQGLNVPSPRPALVFLGTSPRLKPSRPITSYLVGTDDTLSPGESKVLRRCAGSQMCLLHTESGWGVPRTSSQHWAVKSSSFLPAEQL